MTRMTVYLDAQERDALEQLSQRERRDMRDQAALLIRQKLIGRGLLQVNTLTPITVQPAQPEGVSDAGV